MKQKIILFICFLWVTFCHSQTLEKGWSCFDGSIGKNDVVVNVFRDITGNLTGDYCYKKFETRIKLNGKVKDGVIFLDEFTNSKITAKFKGKINEENNTISGKWSSTTHSDLSFFLSLASATGNLIDSKYEMDAADEDVELFFKKTKKAIVADDKIWLSKNTKFPLTLYIQKKKVKVKNASEFLKKYDAIITKKVRKSIGESCVCNIFSTADGAMIANGSIWVNVFEKCLKISAINN